MASSAAKMRRLRARQRAGEFAVPPTSVSTSAVACLAELELLPPGFADLPLAERKAALAEAVTKSCRHW